MRILFEGEEDQIGALNAKGNTIVNGKAVAWNGQLLEGVEDITLYDEEGNEVEEAPVEDTVSEEGI